MAGNSICIDAGASETRIFIQSRGETFIEPSAAAVSCGSDTQESENILFGGEAVRAVTRSPGGRRLI